MKQETRASSEFAGQARWVGGRVATRRISLSFSLAPGTVGDGMGWDGGEEKRRRTWRLDGIPGRLKRGYQEDGGVSGGEGIGCQEGVGGKSWLI